MILLVCNEDPSYGAHDKLVKLELQPVEGVSGVATHAVQWDGGGGIPPLESECSIAGPVVSNKRHRVSEDVQHNLIHCKWTSNEDGLSTRDN